MNSVSADRGVEPYFIALDLTYNCNRKCSFCFLDSTGLKKSGRKPLSFAEIKKFIDELGPRKKEFYVAGGEPLLHPEFFRIAGYIVSKGHRCQVTTNGSLLTPDNCAAMLASGVHEVVISTHGGTSLHDRLVGVPGSFGKIKKAVALLKKNKKRPMLTLWCTVNSLNYQSLYKVYLELKKIGADQVSFNHLDFLRKEDLERTDALFRRYLGARAVPVPNSKMASEINRETLWEQVELVKKAGGKFMPELDREELFSWYDAGRRHEKKGFCLAQWHSMWISPWGDVISCVPLFHRLGNLREKSWREIYNGKKFRAFRKLLIKCGGLLPTCSRCGRESYNAGKLIKY